MMFRFIGLLFLLPLFVFAKNPLYIITTTGPGSLSDTSIRKISNNIEVEMLQPVIILNIPGADGILAMKKAIELSKTDDVILLGNSSLSYVKLVHQNLEFDPFIEFVPISGLSKSEFGIFVSSVSSITSLKDLINTKNLLVGTASPMSIMSAKAIDIKFSTNSTIVNYKSFAQLVADLSENRLNYITAPIESSIIAGFVSTGKIKQLEHLSKINIPDFGWNAIYVHKNMPKDKVRDITKSFAIVVSNSMLPHFNKSTAELTAIQQNELLLMKQLLNINQN